jgi:SAM-dependent methyltransferase
MNKCRFCLNTLTITFVNLGNSPIANNYLTKDQLSKRENYYSLHTYVCSSCLLVQLPHDVSENEIFHKDYAYFSSYSSTWLEHSEKYTHDMISRYQFNSNHLIIEVASNDGCLLRYFKENGVPVLGIDPAQSVAQTALRKGIPTVIDFFGKRLATHLKEQGKSADLIIANNVLAHVPDLNDFVAGFKILLKQKGIATFEFPHLLALINNKAFDTIYHEHFSYFSLTTVEKIFAHHGLTIFNVEELTTHGGSLRVFVRHANYFELPINPRVSTFKNKEEKAGLNTLAGYKNFQEKVKTIKYSLLKKLIFLKENGKTIAGYGAPAKGNTLLNYCGIRTDFLEYTVDRNPHKQGFYLPGTHIPIKSVEELLSTKPDYILILPWNLKDEIIGQLQPVCTWNPTYIVPIEQIKDSHEFPTPLNPRSISHQP